jgi:hypothetical protein
MDLPEPLITISPDYLSGAPIFTGTRVPVQALFDYIEGGDPLDEGLARGRAILGSRPRLAPHRARSAACASRGRRGRRASLDRSEVPPGRIAAKRTAQVVSIVFRPEAELKPRRTPDTTQRSAQSPPRSASPA